MDVCGDRAVFGGQTKSGDIVHGIYCLLGVLLKKYQKTDHVALAPFVLAAEVVLLYLK